VISADRHAPRDRHVCSVGLNFRAPVDVVDVVINHEDDGATRAGVVLGALCPCPTITASNDVMT
jgi:hypothetical protein